MKSKNERPGVPVSCWAADGKFIAQFKSIKLAARASGVGTSGIYQAIKAGNLCNGYKWKRETCIERDQELARKHGKGPNPVAVSFYGEDGNKVGGYPSQKSAAQSMKVTIQSIRKAINTGGFCKGYKWKRDAA